MVTSDRRLAILAKARQARRDKAADSITVIEKPAQDPLAHLDPARRSAVERHFAQMPRLYRRTYLKAIGGRSPMSAVRAFCAECVDWARREAAACTALACPLWPYRPGKDAESPSSEGEPGAQGGRPGAAQEDAE